MDKESFVKMADQRLRLVRTEFGLTQEKAAKVLGISKKTLVEIEKGRRSLGWEGAVCFGSIFSESEILKNDFGGELSDLILSLAFSDVEVKYPKTMGGKVWWKTVIKYGEYKIQRNVISSHFRLLDKDDCRIISSFDLKTVKERLGEEMKQELSDINKKEN